MGLQDRRIPIILLESIHTNYSTALGRLYSSSSTRRQSSLALCAATRVNAPVASVAVPQKTKKEGEQLALNVTCLQERACLMWLRPKSISLPTFVNDACQAQSESRLIHWAYCLQKPAIVQLQRGQQQAEEDIQ